MDTEMTLILSNCRTFIQFKHALTGHYGNTEII